MSSNSNHSHKKQITLESLLKIKKYEQPKPEFWAKFDAELNQKRLRALVKREHWYERLSLNLYKAFKPAFPAATAAMFLFVLFFQQGSSFNNKANFASIGKPVSAVSAMSSLNSSYGLDAKSANYVKNVIPSVGAEQSHFVKVFASPQMTSNNPATHTSLSMSHGFVNKASL